METYGIEFIYQDTNPESIIQADQYKFGTNNGFIEFYRINETFPCFMVQASQVLCITHLNTNPSVVKNRDEDS